MTSSCTTSHSESGKLYICLFFYAADDLTLQKDVDREEGAAQRAAVEELNDDLQCLYEFGKEWLY